MSRRRLDSLSVAIATDFYLSYIPRWLLAREPLRRLNLPPRWTGGGLLGAGLGWALLPLVPRGGAVEALAVAAAAGAACFVCGRAESALGSHDDPRIVLDETVGFWAAAAYQPRSLWSMLAAFALFRLFDAAKPPPIGRLERLPGGIGVVMDDVGAGVLANLVLTAGRRLLRC